MKFRLRIDSERDDDKFIAFLQAYNTYVLVHHVLPHGNPHYHIYLEYNELSIDALRKRVDRYFSIKGADRSIKSCDESRVNEYVQYLFNRKHGNLPTLVKSSNFNDEQLHQLQMEAQNVANEFAQRQKVKRDRKQITQYDLAMQVKERLDALHREDITVRDHTLIAIEVMKANKKAFCRYSLGRIMMTSMSDEKVVDQMQKYFGAL